MVAAASVTRAKEAVAGASQAAVAVPREDSPAVRVLREASWAPGVSTAWVAAYSPWRRVAANALRRWLAVAVDVAAVLPPVAAGEISPSLVRYRSERTADDV